jgi:hypothetical protein
VRELVRDLLVLLQHCPYFTRAICRGREEDIVIHTPIEIMNEVVMTFETADVLPRLHLEDFDDSP